MTDDTIRMALSSIELPEGLEDRLQEKIEGALDMPLREKRVILKPRKRVWLPALCAAAALLLLVLGFSALRQARSAQKQNIALIPAAQPGAETPPDPETDTDPLLPYRPVLDKYLEAFGQDEAARYEELGLSSLCLEFAGNPLRSLGFALADLDGDGVEELIIGTAQNEVYYGTILFDLYSLENGEPVKLAESGKEHVVVRYAVPSRFIMTETRALHQLLNLTRAACQEAVASPPCAKAAAPGRSAASNAKVCMMRLMTGRVLYFA